MKKEMMNRRVITYPIPGMGIAPIHTALTDSGYTNANSFLALLNLGWNKLNSNIPSNNSGLSIIILGVCNTHCSRFSISLNNFCCKQ